MKKSAPLWCEDCRFVSFETGLEKPMLTPNDLNGFKNTTNVYSIHLELRMASPCQISTGKWKYVNPRLDFLGVPDQRTAYVKWQVRPRWTYVRISSVTPDLVTHCEARWQICVCEMVLFREWFSVRSLQAMNLNNDELSTIRLSWTEFCNCFKIKKIQELCVNKKKRLSKQSRHRWFKKPSRSLWRHCIGTNGYNKHLYIIQNSIPEMSHERHGLPNHRLFECLLNNSFRLTSEKRHLTLLALC